MSTQKHYWVVVFIPGRYKRYVGVYEIVALGQLGSCYREWYENQNEKAISLILKIEYSQASNFDTFEGYR